MGEKRKAVFIDRDGTLTREVGYVNYLDRLELLPNSAEAVRLLNQNAIQAVVVTNQAGAARGYFPLEYIDKVHERLVDLLKKQGAKIDGIYVGPHLPNSVIENLRIDCMCPSRA